jgi:YVTN family beta-propeller protein
MKKLRHCLFASALLFGSAWSTLAQPTVGKSAKVEAVGIYEIVFNPTENAVYVASAGPRGENVGKVLKLDPKTLQVLSTIEKGAERPYGLGLNVKTQTLYTTNTVTGTVSAVDLKSGKITVIKKDGLKPHFREAIVDEESNTVYVSVAARGNSSIWVIDGNKNELSRIIENTGNVTTGMALDKANNRLWITNMSDHKIAAIDLATDKIVQTFEAGGENPTNLILDAKTNRLFVANQKTNNLTVLDAKSGALLKAVPTGEGALGVNFNPQNNRIYVANRGAGTVTVIDAKSYEVLANLPTGTHPNTVAVDVKTGAAYVTNKAKRMPEGETDAAGDTVSLIAP